MNNIQSVSSISIIYNTLHFDVKPTSRSGELKIIGSIRFANIHTSYRNVNVYVFQMKGFLP